MYIVHLRCNTKPYYEHISFKRLAKPPLSPQVKFCNLAGFFFGGGRGRGELPTNLGDTR